MLDLEFEGCGGAALKALDVFLWAVELRDRNLSRNLRYSPVLARQEVMRGGGSAPWKHKNTLEEFFTGSSELK